MKFLIRLSILRFLTDNKSVGVNNHLGSYGTLHRAGFPFDDYPHINDWHARIMERDAAKRAVADWAREPRMGVTEMAAGA